MADMTIEQLKAIADHTANTARLVLDELIDEGQKAIDIMNEAAPSAPISRFEGMWLGGLAMLLLMEAASKMAPNQQEHFCNIVAKDAFNYAQRGLNIASINSTNSLHEVE